MTVVTPSLENTRFSLFLNYTVLRPPGVGSGVLFMIGCSSPAQGGGAISDAFKRIVLEERKIFRQLLLQRAAQPDKRKEPEHELRPGSA